MTLKASVMCSRTRLVTMGWLYNMAIGGLAWPQLWIPAAVIFIVGWVLQFIGHWYEGQPPEFFRDWRFLFVGLRWWFAKISGKA